MYKYNLPYSQIDLDHNLKPFTIDIMVRYGVKFLILAFYIAIVSLSFIYKETIIKISSVISEARIPPEEIVSTLFIFISCYALTVFLLLFLIRRAKGISLSFSIVPKFILFSLGFSVIIYWTPYLNTLSIFLLYTIGFINPLYRLLKDVVALIALYKRKWLFTDIEIELIEQKNYGMQIINSTDSIRKINKKHYGSILEEIETVESIKGTTHTKTK